MVIQTVIPHLSHPEKVVGCLESMGKIEMPVLVVDNSATSEILSLGLQPPVEVETWPGRLSVSGSWNRGIIRDPDYTLICSNRVRFGEGGLSRIINEVENRQPEFGLFFAEQGYHLILISRKTIGLVGLFDENYWPGYNEDDDFVRRMDLAGIPHFDNWAENGTTLVEGQEKLYSGYDAAIQWTGRIQNYYEHKWGMPSGEYKPEWTPFTRPFNNPNNGLDYWPKVRYEPRLGGGQKIL